MKLLPDTHIILWALDDNPKLPLEARTFIMDEKNDIYYSTASVWETAIKYMSRPDKIWIGGSKLSELCRKMGYRMMIAQAKADGLKFVTHDYKISFYEEPCVLSV